MPSKTASTRPRRQTQRTTEPQAELRAESQSASTSASTVRKSGSIARPSSSPETESTKPAGRGGKRTKKDAVQPVASTSTSSSPLTDLDPPAPNVTARRPAKANKKAVAASAPTPAPAPAPEPAPVPAPSLPPASRAATLRKGKAGPTDEVTIADATGECTTELPVRQDEDGAEAGKTGDERDVEPGAASQVWEGEEHPEQEVDEQDEIPEITFSADTWRRAPVRLEGKAGNRQLKVERINTILAQNSPYHLILPPEDACVTCKSSFSTPLPCIISVSRSRRSRCLTCDQRPCSFTSDDQGYRGLSWLVEGIKWARGRARSAKDDTLREEWKSIAAAFHELYEAETGRTVDDD